MVCKPLEVETKFFCRIPVVNLDEVTTSPGVCCEFMEEFENNIGGLFLGTVPVFICWANTVYLHQGCGAGAAFCPEQESELLHGRVGSGSSS